MPGLAAGLACIVAFTVAVALSRRLARRPLAALMDHPNARSLHDAPTPRSGGLAILAALVCAAVVLAGAGVRWPGGWWLGAGLAIVGAISFADDLSHVNQGLRLAAHLVAAALALAAGIVPARVGLAGLEVETGGSISLVLAALLVAWLVNLYNFMDGMDGFAGGMGLIGFATLALLGVRAGDATFALCAACVASASAGFLVTNFPPARIFMGDLGASMLGFLAGVAVLAGAARGLFALWVGLLVFSPFLVDATVTLARRVLRGEPFWRAHKSHYYQRLVELGWGHRRTVLAEYAVMVAAGVSALAASSIGPAGEAVLLGAWALAYTIGAVLIERAHARRRSHGPDAAA